MNLTIVNKVVIPLLKTFGAGFIGSFFSTILLYFLNNEVTKCDISSLYIPLGIFIDTIICFLVCVFVYLPICIYDRKKINEYSFKKLIERYIPIIAIPLGIIFCLLYFLFMEIRFSIIVALFFSNVLFVSYVSLCVFTKSIK